MRKISGQIGWSLGIAGWLFLAGIGFGQGPTSLPPVVEEHSVKGPSCPIRVIVHVEKPEVVIDNSGQEGSQQSKTSCCQKFCCFKRRAAPPAPMVGSIYLPVPAVVPGLPVHSAGPVLPLAPPAAPQVPNVCGGGAPQGADFPVMRATHELEVGLARIQAAKAAQIVEIQAQQEAMARIRASIAQLSPSLLPPNGVAPRSMPPADDGSLEALQQNLNDYQEALHKHINHGNELYKAGSDLFNKVHEKLKQNDGKTK